MVLSRNNDKSVSSKQGSTSTASVTKAEASHNKKKSRKTYQLNRFLSKTFHLVNNSDPKIVAWAASGDSFIVFDVDAFAEKVLPQYFKHSKFSSFIRQLNFYGFRKIRADNDPLSQEIGMPYGSVRFFHPNFQPKRPDLLHKIHRATKTTSVSEEASSNDEEEEEPDQQLVESLQSQIDMLTEKLESAEERMDAKIGQIRESFESDYQRRISGLERAYHDLILSTLSPSSQLSLGRAPAGLGLPPPSSSALSSLLATSISGPALMALSAASGSGRRGGGSPLDSADRKYNIPSTLASFLR